MVQQPSKGTATDSTGIRVAEAEAEADPAVATMNGSVIKSMERGIRGPEVLAATGGRLGIELIRLRAAGG